MAAVADGAVGRRETLPLGPMRLASHSPARLRPLERRIAKELDCVGWIDAERGETLYLVGGAWRALARAYMHLTGYPVKVVHYFGLSRTRAMEAADTVLRVDPAILRAVPKMSGKRLETMPYAALTLRQLLRRVGPEEVVFSTYGLREGWVFGDFAPNGPGRDWVLAACRDYRHWAIRASLPAETLAAWAAPMFPTAHHREQRLFLGACHLSNLGWADHPEDRAYHVLSRCLRLAVPGIDHAGRAFIALALYRRYNGDLDDERIAKFDPLLRKEERHRAIVLGSALRLAYALSGGDEEVLAASRLELKGRKLTLELQEQVRPFLGDGVHRRIAELGRSLGVKTQIVVKEARVAGARAPRRRAG
jgi:exopolyphosphatase/guanosine-5'-triphosphate,3'-diphosphate pyrophosphatase